MREDKRVTYQQICFTDEHIETKERLHALINERRKKSGTNKAFIFWNWVKENLDREEAMNGKGL